MNNNNLSKLNDNLFELFNDVKEGKIEKEKAETLVSISNTIINNAKTQIQGISAFQKAGYIPDVIEGTSPQLIGDTFEKKTQFSKSIGFKGVADAIGNLGKDNFNKQYSEYANS